ncbi:MAG: N-acetyl-gamma-glutamyl-phosphate reductase [Gammaproteobacteria bacterium]
MRAGIVGGSGYVGGELLRLLLGHPELEVQQVSSETWADQPVAVVHPNLRHSRLKFRRLADLEPCELLFVTLPHGVGVQHVDRVLALAPRVVDLSADFRLADADAYARWYGMPHPRPDLLGKFVCGLPELHRAQLRGAALVAVPGCMATAAILALGPPLAAGLIEPRVIVDAKMGSSGSGGRQTSLGSHHAERSVVMRSFKPTGHRHTGEILQSLAAYHVEPYVSATAVGAVRGVLVTAHAFLQPGTGKTAVWRAYRSAYGDEPFIRLVARSTGLHRLPEPSILAGSNFADVGFELDGEGPRIVLLGALDNLGKGAAGNAVQCANLMADFPERAGLGFPGLHPV